MKAKRNTLGLLHFVIFATFVALGTTSGIITGDYRIGAHIGMALGLMGIIGFRLILERRSHLVQVNSGRK